MVTARKIERNGVIITEYRGLSSDNKPSNAIANDIFVETNRDKRFIFNGTTWVPRPYDLDGNASGISYVTTAPTSDNTDGGVKICILDSEPATKYNGWLYFITEE